MGLPEHCKKPLARGAGLLYPFFRVQLYNNSCLNRLQAQNGLNITFVDLHKVVVLFMDIVLERILSIIPKNEKGKFRHGALSEFARNLGFKDGHIISDWIAENSKSYMNYLYEIAAKYDVSVEWLKGETDDMGGTGKLREKRASALAGAAGVAAGIAGAALLPGAAAIAAIDTAGIALLSGKKKEPALSEDELDAELMRRLIRLTPQELALVDAYVQGLLAKREGPPSLDK